MKVNLARSFGALMAAFLAVAPPSAADGVALRASLILPDPAADPMEDGVVLIRDGIIEAVGSRHTVSIPDGYELIDREDATLVHGFWNSHVHLITPELLDPEPLNAPRLEALLTQMFSRWGFTTIYDITSTTGGALALRRRIDAGQIAGPRVLTVGDPFYPLNGTPVQVRGLLPDSEILSIEHALARLEAQGDQGTHGIKLFVGSIGGDAHEVVMMSADQIRPLSDAAHARGQVVFAHPTTQEGVRLAAENGADILAHAAPLGGPWTPEFAAELAEAGLALSPAFCCSRSILIPPPLSPSPRARCAPCSTPAGTWCSAQMPDTCRSMTRRASCGSWPK